MNHLMKIPVVAGVIYHGNKLLVAQRKKGDLLEDLWEFPGGKIDQGESGECALIREIKEELGMVITVERLLVKNIHHYPTKTIELFVFICKTKSMHFVLNEHQSALWIKPSEIINYEFAPADKPVLQYL